MIRLISLIFIILMSCVLTACKTTEPLAVYRGDTAEQIFNQAERNLAAGHYESAAKDFEALDALYPFGAYSQQGQLDIIYAYYKKGDDAESALAAADRYIRLYPRSSSVDYAYYMKGLINMGSNDGWLDRLIRSDPAQRDLSGMDQAFQDFSLLVQRFPNSRYAPDARKRMLYIRNLLAQNQLEIAQFYLKRKAYVAAANRATNIVSLYQGSPQVVPALGIMYQSYRALNENKMADDTLRLLITNYPNSSEAKRFSSRVVVN